MTVTILKDIQPHEGHSIYYKQGSRIEYDAKSPRSKKTHILTYQQGSHWGEVGDNCYWLTHEELLDLEQRGFVRINRRNSRNTF